MNAWSPELILGQQENKFFLQNWYSDKKYQRDLVETWSGPYIECYNFKAWN